MYEWQRQIKIIIDEIDQCIKNRNGEAITLRFLSRRLVIPNIIQRENSKKYQVCNLEIT